MFVFAGVITDGGLLGWAALLLGITSLLLGIGQLAMLRRVNLVPAIVGAIAVTFFAGLLSQSLGQYYTYHSLGAAYPEERMLIIARTKAVSMYPALIGLTFCFFSGILGTVAATLRANLKPR